MDILFSIILWVLCSCACYKIAKKNDMNVTLAIILGLIFGIYAVLIYVFIGEESQICD